MIKYSHSFILLDDIYVAKSYSLGMYESQHLKNYKKLLYFNMIILTNIWTIINNL